MRVHRQEAEGGFVALARHVVTLPVTPAATDSDPDEGAMPEAALTEPAAPIRSASAVTPASPDYAATLAELDTFTGILIDARHLPEISRSPAPALYGPAPALALLYPDRAHVPTPDEVQEQSIVRYYHTTLAARKGVAGDNPLILPARAVRGFAQDSLELSASDRALLAALDKKLGFSRTWRVGFLVPASR
ncbi:MAG: hypothetical protein H7Z41_12395 [Cytophagales bacterium]|nr:hypothetical protein [Armatimonadota bacterium]